MRSQRKEADYPCNECRFFVAAKRGLEGFPDGVNYMVTGTCDNPQSPLYKRKLTGSFTASVNAMHSKLDRAMTIACFTLKES